MMKYMDLPMAFRQVQMIITFCCMISLVLPMGFFFKRKKNVYFMISAFSMVLAYFCIQIMCGVAKHNAWDFVYEGFNKSMTELSAVAVMVCFSVLVGLSVWMIIKTRQFSKNEIHNIRFRDIKVRIHDTFGLSLIASKAYYDGQEVDRETVKLLYDKCKDCFTEESLFSYHTYENIYQIGRLIGVNLSITGTLPEEDGIKSVVCAALSECMINTFRHAWGDMVFVNISDGECTEITIRNNGKPPVETIHERGGLKHLRDYAESLGIKMTIISKPHFSLTLSIPKEA